MGLTGLMLFIAPMRVRLPSGDSGLSRRMDCSGATEASEQPASTIKASKHQAQDGADSKYSMSKDIEHRLKLSSKYVISCMLQMTKSLKLLPV